MMTQSSATSCLGSDGALIALILTVRAPDLHMLTRGHDESWGRVFGQDGHPPQLDVEELTPALGQVEGAAFTELGGEEEEVRASEQVLTGLWPPPPLPHPSPLPSLST